MEKHVQSGTEKPGDKGGGHQTRAMDEGKDGSDTKEKYPHARREEHLRSKLKSAEEEIKALQERLLRTAAELDNFRKRAEKEKIQLILNANADLLKSVLPILDDLERSLKASSENDVSGFRNGIELIYQKLFSILKNQGMAPMETVGQRFDVEKHDALLLVEKEGTEPGIVVEEYERGYLLNGQVLRHAKVTVSK
jgi:molecular chaperone GrpE